MIDFVDNRSTLFPPHSPASSCLPNWGNSVIHASECGGIGSEEKKK